MDVYKNVIPNVTDVYPMENREHGQGRMEWRCMMNTVLHSVASDLFDSREWRTFAPIFV